MATAKPLVFSIRLTDWPLLGIILTTNGSCGLGNEFPNEWIPRKVFLCSLALLLRVRFRGYSFLISFVACLVTCEQAFSFLFSKQEGRRVPPRAVVSPGQTLRPSWRNHCSQGRRRIAWSQDTCLLSSIALGTGIGYGFGLRAGQSSFSLRTFLCSQPGLARHLRAGLVLSSP